jgi:hypothetical protein
VTDENKLVFANFFFWQPGSSLQKSLNGLYRSLLYEVLKSHPEMVPNVFPHVWAIVRARARVRGAVTKVELEEDEIAKAFTFLISQKDSSSGYSVCFFIDGLDEFQANTHDHKDLAIKLADWTTNSNVKICVSSREQNAFMNTFSSMLRIRLHTLTQYDIKAYINNRLEHSQDTGDIQALKKSIFHKANGVFFWVALVIRDIREQLENGVEPSYLVEIVTTFPDELFGLYSQILDGLKPYSRKRAYQTLAMMPYTTGDESELRLDLISYSFLNEYNENDKFARGDQFEARLTSLRYQEREMEENTTLHLNGWCRGLVEVNDDGNIDYAHRSVAEFLTHPRIQEKISSSLQDTHPVSILSELKLAQFRIFPNGDQLLNSPYELVLLRHICELEHPPYEFLCDMDTSLESSIEGIDDTDFHGQIEVAVVDRIAAIAVGPSGYAKRRFLRGNQVGDIRFHFSPCFYPFFHGDERSQLDKHVLWRIENDAATTNTMLKRILLFYAVMVGPAFSILDILLERGIITPETQTTLMPYIKAHRRHEKLWILDEMGNSRSIWEYFLIQEFYTWLSSANYDPNQRFVGVVERFLHYGADPRFRFTTHIIKRPNRPYHIPVTEDNFFFGNLTKSMPVSFHHIWRPIVDIKLPDGAGDDGHKHFEKAISMLWPLPVGSTGPWYQMSFTDWIQAMEDFEGKPDLLELLRDKIRERQNDEMQQSSVVLDTSADPASTTSLVADAPAGVVQPQRGRAILSPNWLYLSSFTLGKLLFKVYSLLVKAL